MRKILLLLALSMGFGVCNATELPSKDSILSVVNRVNDYFMAQWPDPTKDTFVKRRRPSSLWTRGVYYEGLMAVYGISPEERFINYTRTWADYHKWTPRNGTTTTHADNQCCCQTYLDMYEMMHEQQMIDSVRTCLELQMASGRADYWTWIDAIQMAMPVYTKMYRLTLDERYLLYARECYLWTRNECGGGLWNAKDGLWWRDKDFVPPYKEQDGNNCYWSRGNGWVVAAYVKCISDIEEATKNAKGSLSLEGMAFLHLLKDDYTSMMSALVKCQREDGFWNVSLHSPVTFGGKETTGTSMFCMGLAWGVRRGMLDAKTYLPAACRAWDAMVRDAVHPDGYLGYVQGTGKEPKDGQPVTYTSRPDFDDYGTGCFLMAAVEMYRLVSGPIVAATSKPGVRWWWLGSAVDKQNLTWNMEQMAQKGIGALEITPIYGVQGNDSNNISFLSDEWKDMLSHCISEGKRLGIQIDMNMGTGWPFGGPTTPIDEAACRLVVVDTIVSKASLASYAAPMPLIKSKGAMIPDEYARQIFQRDYRTDKKGMRRMITLFESRTRQKVKRAAPGGEGYVVDHYDSLAVAHYLQKFEGMPMPETLFNDSYEVYNADWTPTLLREFKARRGYRLEDRMQEFVDGNAQVVSDYRETLSELLLKNFTEQWVAWAHRHGVKVRNQAHGSPANLIDLYAAVDIPEIEGFGLTDFGIRGLRTDSGLTRPNYSDLSMLKYASSAAHICGKPLTSSETFTWLTEHFRTSLSQMKPDLDLMFCSGVNRVFFHGACYSPKDDPWPGWRFYASVDFSPTNTIWRDADGLTQYIRYCQDRLQQGAPDNDFLVLLPIRNMWQTDTKKRYMMFDIHSMDRKAPEFISSILAIDSLGYDCDYVSERYLLSTKAENGMLLTAGGTQYKALIVPENCIVPKAIERHIAQLEHQGARIIRGIQPGIMAEAARPEAIRTDLHLKMLRRRSADGFRYFVSNLTPNDVDTCVTLASTGCNVHLQLASGESCFLDTNSNGAAVVDYPLAHTSASQAELLDLSHQPWTLTFTESQPIVADTIRLSRLQSWETLPNDSIRELMGTGVYETMFTLPTLPSTPYAIDLGDVRESARVYINGTFIGTAWCVPFRLPIPSAALRQGDNTLRIEVTNLPANRIAAFDRRGIPWRKFNEINVVNINYKKDSYTTWQAVPSGLNSYVRICASQM